MSDRQPATEAGRSFFSRLWAVNDYAGASKAIATAAYDIARIEAEASRGPDLAGQLAKYGWHIIEWNDRHEATWICPAATETPPGPCDPDRCGFDMAVAALQAGATEPEDAGPEHVHHGLWCAACVAHGASGRTAEPLDVERVHRLTCPSLIDHEPGSDRPYLWPCTKFAREYLALASSDTEPRPNLARLLRAATSDVEPRT